jgi:hypothetical protein
MIEKCERHQKRIYLTEFKARAAIVEGDRRGTHDPGLEPYPCSYSGAWHVGHRSRGRSLARLLEDEDGPQ